MTTARVVGKGAIIVAVLLLLLLSKDEQVVVSDSIKEASSFALLTTIKSRFRDGPCRDDDDDDDDDDDGGIANGIPRRISGGLARSNPLTRIEVVVVLVLMNNDSSSTGSRCILSLHQSKYRKLYTRTKHKITQSNDKELCNSVIENKLTRLMVMAQCGVADEDEVFVACPCPCRYIPVDYR